MDDWYFTNNDATLIVPFPSLDKIHFKKLTNFTFSGTYWPKAKEDHDERFPLLPEEIAAEAALKQRYITWIQSLIPSFHSSVITLRFIDCCQLLVSTFLTEIKKPSLFPKLEGIHMDLKNSASYLQLLLDIDKPLKSLELNLNGTGDLTVEKINLFENLLIKQAFSLYFDMGYYKEGEEMKITLPVLPKLKYLRIGLDPQDKTPRGGGVPTKLAFGGCKSDGIDGDEFAEYGHHFPLLETLTLWAGPYRRYRTAVFGGNIKEYWNKYEAFFRPFFFCANNTSILPNNICETLKILDIPYEAEHDQERNTPFPKVVEMSKTFPRVENKWFNSVRNKKKNMKEEIESMDE